MTTTHDAWHGCLARALATLALLGSAACTIENPCPVATMRDLGAQACVDAGEKSLGDGSQKADIDQLVGDARVSEDAAPQARDAAPPSTSEPAVAPPGPMPTAEDAGPVAPPATAGEPWPNHVMPVCWAPETVARQDFATLSARFRSIAEAGWPSAANVQLQGFDACAGTTTGVLVLRLVDGFALEVTEGYLARGGEHRLTIGIARKDLFEGLIPHALAHALGLTDAPHVHDGCAGAPATNTLDERGECRPRIVLSLVDRARARLRYGALPAEKLDPRRTSFDGDRAADLLFLEPAGEGARVGVALSSGHDFAAPFSGTWAQLATMPSGVYPGDYNGDGLTDLGVYDGARGAFSVRLSTGTSFDGPQAELWHAEAMANSKVMTGDYDNDGKTDLAFMTPSRHLLLVRSTDTGFAPASEGLSGEEFGGVEGRHLAGDFDGDGDIDLAYLESTESVGGEPYPLRNTMWMALFDGTRFRNMGYFLGSGDFGGLVGEHYTIDVQGDGRDELAYYEPVDGAVWPAGYKPPASHVPWEPRHGAPAKLSGLATPQLADFDGDGVSDLAYLDLFTTKVHLRLTREDRLEPSGATPLAAAMISLLASSRDSRGR